MKATIQRINGTALVGRGGSNHWVVMDGPEDYGGFSAGTRPMEMILIGLAVIVNGCVMTLRATAARAAYA